MEFGLQDQQARLVSRHNEQDEQPRKCCGCFSWEIQTEEPRITGWGSYFNYHIKRFNLATFGLVLTAFSLNVYLLDQQHSLWNLQGKLETTQNMVEVLLKDVGQLQTTITNAEKMAGQLDAAISAATLVNESGTKCIATQQQLTSSMITFNDTLSSTATVLSSQFDSFQLRTQQNLSLEFYNLSQNLIAGQREDFREIRSALRVQYLSMSVPLKVKIQAAFNNFTVNIGSSLSGKVVTAIDVLMNQQNINRKPLGQNYVTFDIGQQTTGKYATRTLNNYMYYSHLPITMMVPWNASFPPIIDITARAVINAGLDDQDQNSNWCDLILAGLWYYPM